jgi:malate dehydrogenase (oxaloacetate-decarboxylating)(NADP+)
MDDFMHEMTTVFPKLLIQFEVHSQFRVSHHKKNNSMLCWQDFASEKAFRYLDRYRHKYPIFNDDIQGTGAVVLSGFLNAAHRTSLASGKPLSEHRILFLGTGSVGVGVAMQLTSFFTLHGLSVEEAKRRIWLVDSQGLVYNGRGALAEHKKCALETLLNFDKPC